MNALDRIAFNRVLRYLRKRKEHVEKMILVLDDLIDNANEATTFPPTEKEAEGPEPLGEGVENSGEAEGPER